MFRNYPQFLYEPGKTIVNMYNMMKFVDDFVANSAARLKPRPLTPGDTPEDISFELYGDDRYWFLILLMNGVKDPFYDWVKTDDEIHEYSIAYVDAQQDWDLNNPIAVTERQALIDAKYTEVSQENDQMTILVPDKDMMQVIYNEWQRQASLFGNDVR